LVEYSGTVSVDPDVEYRLAELGHKAIKKDVDLSLSFAFDQAGGKPIVAYAESAGGLSIPHIQASEIRVQAILAVVPWVKYRSPQDWGGPNGRNLQDLSNAVAQDALVFGIKPGMSDKEAQAHLFGSGPICSSLIPLTLFLSKSDPVSAVSDFSSCNTEHVTTSVYDAEHSWVLAAARGDIQQALSKLE
jgi:hypothetical protein